MSNKVILSFESEREGGKELVFQERILLLVGRASECACRFQCLHVSRRHCLLDIDPPNVKIRDLESRNGTYVNGQRIEGEHRLVEGDVVRIGSEAFSIHVEGPAQALENVNELAGAGV